MLTNITRIDTTLTREDLNVCGFSHDDNGHTAINNARIRIISATITRKESKLLILALGHSFHHP